MGKRNGTRNEMQLSLWDDPVPEQAPQEEQKALQVPVPSTPPEPIEHQHHHIEIWFRDGRRVTLCMEQPDYREKSQAGECYSSGFVGGAVTREECSICNKIEEKLDMESLLIYGGHELKYHGKHDLVRREWLRNWAKERGYRDFRFTYFGKYDGYTWHYLRTGEEEWNGFLTRAVQVDIYFCFVSAFAPHPLKRYLEDAVSRGVLNYHYLHYDELVWKPSNQNVPRDPKWLNPNRR